MNWKQRVIVSTFPEDFDGVVEELTRRGIVLVRRVRDLGVIAAELDREEVPLLRAIPGVQDIEVEESPFSG